MDKKEKRENSRPGGAKRGHEPHSRRLADNLYEFRDHAPVICEDCGGAFSGEEPRGRCHGGDPLPNVRRHYIQAA
jgi:hypothetical protein